MGIDDVKMYENELSVIVDDEKTNFTRTRAATTQIQTKKKKQSPDANRRRSFQQSNVKTQQYKMLNGLRSKSAASWSDEEDEKSESVQPAVNIKSQQINHHSHRSSAEKLEIYKQKLFSPKQHP